MQKNTVALPPYCTMTEDQVEYYRQIERELNMIMDKTFDLITIADKNGILIRVSKSCSELFGVPIDEIVGVHAQVLETKGILNKSVTLEVLKDKQKKSLIQDTKAGRRLMVTGRPIFDENGEFVGVLNISQDITKIELLNKQLEDTEGVLEWYRDEMRRKQAIEREIIFGNSYVMKNVKETIGNIAGFDTLVLLHGETGVGKSMFAKMIHMMSKRRCQPFIQVNCGAIPENLLESELFGYEEGAFTGASKHGKKGLFESANGGTILLDEISEIPYTLQVKMLHALQEKEIHRVGAVKPHKIDARIITATNKDLEKMVKEGKFREDLFYRLNVMPIWVPPLRERDGDIEIFIAKFLEKYNRVYCKNCKLTTEAYSYLTAYQWPGNIRELENTVERIVITSHENLVKKQDIMIIIKPAKKLDYTINDIIPIKEATEEIERQLLIKAFEKYKTTRKVGNVLGIDQSTVVKKIKRYGINIKHGDKPTN